MNKATLAQKLQTLASYPQLNSETVAKFGDILQQLDDWELFRLNPLFFAARYDFPPQEIIDIFVHGAKIGLLDFSFQTVCTCGVTEYGFTVLHELPEEGFYCSFCDGRVLTDLDDRVEVLFNLNSSVKQLAIDPYINIATYLKYFHSPNRELSPQYWEFLENSRCGEFLVAADTTYGLTFNALPNS